MSAYWGDICIENWRHEEQCATIVRLTLPSGKSERIVVFDNAALSTGDHLAELRHRINTAINDLRAADAAETERYRRAEEAEL